MTAPSNANTSGLAPCPFCGGEAWLNDYEAKYSDLPPKSRCPQCRSCGASLGYLATPAKATEAWNRRVTTASAQAIIDRLKLAVCGGEDVPGSIALVTVEDCERFCREAQAQHGNMIERATAAEARADRLAKALEPFNAAYKAYVAVYSELGEFMPTASTEAEQRFAEGEREDTAKEAAFDALSRITFDHLYAVGAALQQEG